MKLFTHISHLFHGEEPHLFDIVAVYVFASAVGVGVVFISPEKSWADWIMALLAADIAGGIVSNATVSTRTYWRKQPKRDKGVYVVLHAMVYPAILVVLGGFSGPLGWVLLAALATKLSLFAAVFKN